MSDDAQSRSRVKTAEGTPESVQVPNLSEVTRTKHRERTAEVARLAGVEPEAPASATTPAASERNFDAEIEALDPALRDHFSRRISDGYNQQLDQQYGDVMPLFMEARNNPALRKNLAAFASEKELRDILADENAPKRLKRAADKQLEELYDNDDFRKFVNDEALPIYRQYQPATTQQQATPAKSEELTRLEALESRYDADRDTQATKGYVQNRIREHQALASKYPSLAENQAMLKHVIGRAEKDFIERARIAGITIDDEKNPGWPAQAMRAGIKPMAYHDAYTDYASFNAVPAASSEAAPTGAVGDTRVQRPAREPVAAGGKHTLSKDQLKERGLQALANFRKQQKKGLTQRG